MYLEYSPSLDLRAQMHVVVVGASWAKVACSCGVLDFTAETFQNPVLEKKVLPFFCMNTFIAAREGA